MKTTLPLLALLVASGCSGPAGEARTTSAASELEGCAALGGGLAFADARTGAAIACAHVEITGAGGNRLFVGSTDRNGLVGLEPDEGAELTVELEGYGKSTAVPGRPFGPEAPLFELWREIPSPRLRVLDEDGIALGGAKVRLTRGSEAIFEGQTNALGALVGVPAQLDGLSAQAEGYSAAVVDPAARVAQLTPQQPVD